MVSNAEFVHAPLKMLGQVGRAVDAFVGPLALVKKYGDLLELRGARQFGPEVLGEFLRPAFQVGVVLTLERAVAVADEQVVLEWLA